MSRSQLQQYCGLAAIAAGVLVAVAWIMVWRQGAPASTSSWLLLIGHLLLTFGILGIYVATHEGAGSLGFLGFALLLLANPIIVSSVVAGDVETALSFDTLMPLANVGMGLGTLLLAAGVWNTDALPKNSTALWGLGGVLTSIGVFMSPPPSPANALTLIGVIVLAIGIWFIWKELKAG
ncbi:MAG: hypothetical protein ACE5EL_04925, partial [Anaerolineae bacterium]